MAKMQHTLKVQREYFQAIADNRKTFEARYDDRNYEVGDWVVFREVNPIKWTGREIGPYEIGYILKGGQFGIEKNWCVFTLK